MEFKKYPNITNSYAESFISNCRRIVPPTEVWVMTEKIHGSNFAFYTDGQEVRLATRNAFLAETERFHGSDRIFDQYKQAVLDLHQSLALPKPIAVYGELFGGSYPHPEVKAIDGVKPVQKGVYYSPDYCFMAFDVAIFPLPPTEEGEGEAGEPTFLSWDLAFTLCTKSGLPFTPALRQGTLDELLTCLDLNTFQTHIPNLLGLPPLLSKTAGSSNIAEGVVIRPMNDYRQRNRQRLMIKMKSEKFREKTPRSGGAPASTMEVAIDPAPYVNEARLHALLSKDSERTFTHPGDVIKALRDPFVMDIVEELDREHPLMASLNKFEKRALKKKIVYEVKGFLMTHANALIQGTF